MKAGIKKSKPFTFTLNLKNYIQYKFFNRVIKSNEKDALIKNTSISSRRLLQIISHFLSSGYNCYLDYSFLQYLSLKQGKYHIYHTLLEGVNPTNKKIKYFPVIISDSKKTLDSFDSNSLKICVNHLMMKDRYNNISAVTENDFYYPIALHKNFLNPAFEAEILKSVLKYERKIGAIFAGKATINFKKNSYNRSTTKELLNINTRFEVFSYICEKLPEEYLYLPDSLEAFLNDMESGYLKNKIVLLNTKERFSIPRDKYFYVLLNSNFFIHMAGTGFPFCHNQMESMLAGCIPITQFARFFVPNFKHELNSLLYNTLDELILLLSNVASDKYLNSVSSMHTEVVSYYKKYYSFDSFKNKLDYLIKNNIKCSNYFVHK